MFFNFPVSPPAASNWAFEHDTLFWILTALTVFFTVAVMSAIIFFAVRYREGNKVDRSRPMYENLQLEITWTVIPLLMGVAFFFFSANLFIRMKTPPKDTYDIYVIGKQWMWHVQHSNGVRENNTLHVPVGRDVRIIMISQDVIHAFYIPAFRVQMHVVPGRYTQMWFNPTKAGTYHLFCGMYCGTQHSEMGGKVVAMEPAAFANWISNNGQSVAPMSMVQAGEKVYNRVACGNCHGGVDNLRAPTLDGILGTKRVFTDRTSIVADEAYIRESILRPYNHITQGYDKTMPPYEGQLSELEVLQLIAYIKDLGFHHGNTMSSIVNREAAVTETSASNVKTTLAVGAIETQTPRPDATPTLRTEAPAVGAIAAQGMNR